MKILALLLVALPQSGETVRERALRLAKDPVANREELLKLGTGAIRPLIEAARPEAEPLLFELKFAGAGAALVDKMRSGTTTFTVRDFSVDDAVRLAVAFAEIPVIVDPGLRAELADTKVTLDVQSASLKAILDLVCLRTGLDYGWIRGRVVLSRADRLWPWPAEKPRRLTLQEEEALLSRIAQLNDDSIEVRADASAAIEALGESALPFLDEAAGRGEAEPRARARDLIARIRARSRPAGFARAMGIERQKLRPAEEAILRTLKERTTEAIDVTNVPLSAAVELLLSQSSLEGKVQPGAAAVKVDCVFDGVKAADALFFVTIPYGFDVYVDGGRIVVDTIEKVEAALQKP